MVLAATNNVVLVKVLKALLALCPAFFQVFQAETSTLHWSILSEVAAAESCLLKTCPSEELICGDCTCEKSQHAQMKPIGK